MFTFEVGMACKLKMKTCIRIYLCTCDNFALPNWFPLTKKCLSKAGRNILVLVSLCIFYRFKKQFAEGIWCKDSNGLTKRSYHVTRLWEQIWLSYWKYHWMELPMATHHSAMTVLRWRDFGSSYLFHHVCVANDHTCYCFKCTLQMFHTGNFQWTTLIH